MFQDSNNPAKEQRTVKPVKSPAHYSFKLLENKSDIGEVIEIARQAHAESRFGYIPFSADKTRKIAISALKNPRQHAVMLAMKHYQPIGLLYCSIGEYHIGTGVLLATVHNINVLKQTRQALGGGRAALGLLRGAALWASARNAKELLLHVTSDVELDRFEKLATRMGFHHIGGSYVKVL